LSRVFFTDRDLGTRFPDILRSACLSIERHRDHFPPDARDEDWLSAIGARGWVALTHDRRIRYKPNELAAVIRHRVSLLVIVGTAPYPALAAAFVATLPRIESFLGRHLPPFVAKVFRASPADLKRDPSATGRVDLWYPR
jgi:hypothetical protein